MRLRLLLLCSSGCLAVVAGGAWELTWQDEFNQPDGSGPDPARWSFDRGGGGWGNNELQCYTDRRVNARIEEGCLVIEAHRESLTDTNNITRDYTSARLKTKDKAAWTYGRIEARIKVASGQGLWPAFWMLGANFDSVGWPKCGEIDIMEHVGRESGRIHGTIHGPGYSGGKGIGVGYTFPDGVNVADGFHLFAVEWEPAQIRWLVDGHHYFTVTPADLPTETQWVFDRPKFLLMNLAVGGNWPGKPGDTTQFPQRMLVDYVRVYTAGPGIASEPKP